MEDEVPGGISSMLKHNRPSRWSSLTAAVLFLAAGMAGFWGAGAVDPVSWIGELVTRTPAAAANTALAESAGETCTKPCCPPKDSGSCEKKESLDAGPQGEAKACCPKCATKSAAQPEGPEQGDACCPPKGGERVGEAALPSADRIVWSQPLIEEYKAKGDWCVSHGVPESRCVKCNPALTADFKAAGNWCSAHEVPEDLCALCNKALVQLGIGRDWCEKHGLPESQCVLCSPERAIRAEDPGKGIEEQLAGFAAATAGARLEEALSSSASSAVAQRTGLNPNCPLHGVKVRIGSSQAVDEAGLKIEPVGTQRITQSLSCYGDVQYDQSRYALLSPRSSGIVQAVKVNLGQKVAAGDVLAVIDSAEFGKAKADFLRAIAAMKRWEWVSDSYQSTNGAGAVARKEVVEAQAELESAHVEAAIARQTLRNFGLSDAEIDAVGEAKDTATQLSLRAPFDSTVVSIESVPGELAERGTPLLAVADLSRMWLCLDVLAKDLPQVSLGMPVAFRADGLEDETFTGTVSWISTDLDPKTRMGEVRAELDNSGAVLRSGLFGLGGIALHQDEEVLAVPTEAVQWDGCCNVVFVQQGADVFEPRKVRLGEQSNGAYVVQAGLLPGERVVTQGSYLMKTEILKGSIGAGCCGND
jgi:cobalt-zinc-cadmium efflux system membrane fusion protein